MYINYLLIKASKSGRKESTTLKQERINNVEEETLDFNKAVGNVSVFKLSPLKGNYKLIIKKGKYHAKP
jgi:hypothetical protein